MKHKIIPITQLQAGDTFKFIGESIQCMFLEYENPLFTYQPDGSSFEHIRFLLPDTKVVFIKDLPF